MIHFLVCAAAVLMVQRAPTSTPGAAEALLDTGAAKGPGNAAIDPRWGNARSTHIADSTMYFNRVRGQGVLIGSVIFK